RNETSGRVQRPEAGCRIRKSLGGSSSIGLFGRWLLRFLLHQQTKPKRRVCKALKGWRRGSESNRRIKVLQTSPLPLGYRAPATTLAFRPEKVYPQGTARSGNVRIWSGRRDLNPRLRPWQGRTLPLSYSRSAKPIINDRLGRSNARLQKAQTGVVSLNLCQPSTQFCAAPSGWEPSQ